MRDGRSIKLLADLGCRRLVGKILIRRGLALREDLAHFGSWQLLLDSLSKLPSGMRIEEVAILEGVK